MQAHVLKVARCNCTMADWVVCEDVSKLPEKRLPFVLQTDVLTAAESKRTMSVDDLPPNRLRGWSAASPEDLIEVGT